MSIQPTQLSHVHLAQLNIARMLAPLTDPIMADLVANLDPDDFLIITASAP